MTHAEARARVTAVLDAHASDGQTWSVDFDGGRREDLVGYLVRHGRTGDFGDHFEELANPLALNVPGAAERTVAALLDATHETALPVAVETRPGKVPLYGVGGTSGLMDIRGVVLALVSSYIDERRDVPEELRYAAHRISTSGTHAGGVTFELARALKTGRRR